MSAKTERLDELSKMLIDEKQKVEGRVHGPVSKYKLDHGDKWRGHLYETATSIHGNISSSLLSYMDGIDQVIKRIEEVKKMVEE